MTPGFMKKKSSVVKLTNERRRHKRHDIAVKVVIIKPNDGQAVSVKASDISDGGVFLAAPAKSVMPQGQTVDMKMYIPRSTANTYMLEEVVSNACVLRHQMLDDNSQVGMALKFDQPLDLGLEV